MIESTLQDGPVRVLLVEDDEDDYVLTRGLLSTTFHNNITLQWARSFEEGMTRIVDEHYDVALVDYRLGVRDGVQLIRDARRAGCRLAIILLTGQDDRAVDLAATEAGASDFLSKIEVNSAMLERAIRYSIQNAKLEEQRVRLLAERSARAEAEAGSRAKDQFLAALSHELRTPLTPVMMAVTAMANDQSLPPALQQDLEMIRRNVELEARLIDDLLDITRVTRGTLQLESAPLDVHFKVQESLKLCRTEIADRQLVVTSRLEATQFAMNGDRGRVQQIIWNLLQNATKYTPPGGAIEVSSWNEPSAKDAATIVIQVKDNGIGIEPAMLPRVFDAFEQSGRPPREEVSGGLGLGLAISKALADLHGGSLVAASDGPGKGSTFTLRLPLAVKRPKVQLPPPASPEKLPPPPIITTRKPHVLFVEDHVDTAMALVRVLKRNGFDVSTSRTVADAVEAIEAGNFDLLISDIGLPDGTGFEVMRHVRSSNKPFPGIVVSGYGMSEDVQSAREAGFEKHLTKPVNPDVLIETVKSLVPSGPPRET